MGHQGKWAEFLIWTATTWEDWLHALMPLWLHHTCVYHHEVIRRKTVHRDNSLDKAMKENSKLSPKLCQAYQSSFQFRNEMKSWQAATFELQIPAMLTTCTVPSTRPFPSTASVEEFIFVRTSVISPACLKAVGCFHHEFSCRQAENVQSFSVWVWETWQLLLLLLQKEAGNCTELYSVYILRWFQELPG